MLAVDIGGTKMAAAVVDPNGEVHAPQRCPTAGADADALFEQLSGMIQRTLDGTSLQPRAIGVGCGGPMSRGGVTVSPLNIPQWREFPLAERLAARHGLPVTLDNDAKALALGEGWLGAAVGCSDYLAMVVSTGVGAGLVTDGRLLDGESGNAGHLGHVIVDPLGHPCACGARGCLEAEVSGTAIARITGAPASAAPEELRVHVGRLVGRAVASVANLLDLRLAVVAGSVALGFGELFFSAAQDELDRCARLSYSQGARIVATGCGEHGPILGAAALARRAAA